MIGEVKSSSDEISRIIISLVKKGNSLIRANRFLDQIFMRPKEC